MDLKKPGFLQILNKNNEYDILNQRIFSSAYSESSTTIRDITDLIIERGEQSILTDQ
jgi:hypothetical protein